MKGTKLHAMLAAMLIVMMVLSACGATATPTPAPTVEPTAEPTAVPPTEEPAAEAPDAGALAANLWQWTSFTSPVEQFDVETPENYVVIFGDDGTVSIKADCNNASGSYTVDAGSLTIEVGPMTVAACPPGSRSDQFVKYLGFAARYFFEDTQLYIDLFADGGTMVFAPGGEAEMTEAAEGAMTGELPAEIVAELDAWLQSQVWTEGGDPLGAVPGLVLLVDTPEGRYLKAAGVSSIEDGTPMQVDDVLEIGSNTKSLTVVLLMQLQEEGVLSMDDMLSEWLPDQAAQLPYGDQITLRQMAQHTAGLWDYADDVMGGGLASPDRLEMGYTPEELVQYAIDNGEPYFAPGAEFSFHYSNTGYILLGMIAEKATGQSLSELYRERIFEPLDLESAILLEDVPQEGEITSQGYYWGDGGRINTTNWNGSQGWAAGSVAMTGEDLAAYGKALAAGELFQNEDSLAQMLAFDASGLYGVMAPYGLGLYALDYGYWGHAGETLGFTSQWATNPEEQTIFVAVTNSGTYKTGNLANVLNIVQGEGAKPFGPYTLMPLGAQISLAQIEAGATPVSGWERWEWVQQEDASGVTDIAPGTLLLLFKEGTAMLTSDACGEAPGTFAVDPSAQLSFDLDASGITCGEEEPAAQLLGLLDSADTWRFENGRLLIMLDDGRSLLFELGSPQ